jgi:uncharacterized membrane protein
LRFSRSGWPRRPSQLNLRRLSTLGVGVASIGGAGTFDGVFLSGIMAVVLVAL